MVTVTRKSSLPYPQSPTASSTRNESFTHASGDLVGNTPDYQSTARPQATAQQPDYAQQYMNNDNPWQDYQSPVAPAGQQTWDAHANNETRQQDTMLADAPPPLSTGPSGQDTPRSSIDSGDSRDWWDDDDVVDGRKSPTKAPSQTLPASLQSGRPSQPDASLPSPSAIKHKPVPETGAPVHGSNSGPDFASNNPFRRPSFEAPAPPSNAPPPVPDSASQEAPSSPPQDKGKAPMREPAFSASITDFSRMTISDGHMPDPSAYRQAQTPKDEAEDPWNMFEAKYAPPSPQAPPPPIPQSSSPLPPSNTTQEQASDHLPNPWASQPGPPQTPSPIPFAQSQKHVTQYNSNLLDRGQHTGAVALRDELSDLPNAASKPSVQSEPSLLDDEDDGNAQPTHQPPSDAPGPSAKEPVYAPPPGPPPGRSLPIREEQTPPAKPPRPTVVTSAVSQAELAKNAEFRNDTYQIKHFNWFDHGSGRLRRSSMLTQNKNGPCPLLALVNALILGARDESQAALDDALRSREQVSLGLIIETLMYELVDRSAANGHQLPDVDELNAFLMRLRTGMNANPRFIPPSGPPPNLMDARHSMLHMPQQQRSQIKAGTFEATGDIKLYGAFSVPLVHGWIPDVDSHAAQAFARSAPTYEDAQAIQFSEEELEYKLTREGLTPDEQRVWEDINSIKNFFKLHPTQLTRTGLENIQQSLSSGGFAIMFRNDHFSTIYKHPQSGQLFTLITDAGYADRDEIIWESLVDISGRGNEFFSGDFMPVSHLQDEPSQSQQQEHLSVAQAADNAPLSPQQQQEQHDADFAMALQLQEEEEQRQRAEQSRRRRSGQNGSGSGPTTQSPRGSTGNIPITLTRSRQSQSDFPENRPSIPPRNQRPHIPAVNRPADAADDDAPPAYEEAAKGRPYVPPVGSPLHPHSDPAGAGETISPMASNSQLTGTISNAGSSASIHPPGPNAPFYSSSSIGGGSGGGSSGSGQRPGHGRIPSNVSGRRVSAYQETQSLQTPGGQSMPGSWSGQRPGMGNVPYQQDVPPVENTGKRRRGDCVVM